MTVPFNLKKLVQITINVLELSIGWLKKKKQLNKMS